MWNCVFYGDALRLMNERSSFQTACVRYTGQQTEQETFQKNKVTLIL